MKPEIKEPRDSTNVASNLYNGPSSPEPVYSLWLAQSIRVRKSAVFQIPSLRDRVPSPLAAGSDGRDRSGLGFS